MSDVELDVSRVFDLESGCVEERIDGGGDGRVLDVRVVNPRNLRVAGVSDEEKFASDVDRETVRDRV